MSEILFRQGLEKFLRFAKTEWATHGKNQSVDIEVYEAKHICTYIMMYLNVDAPHEVKMNLLPWRIDRRDRWVICENKPMFELNKEMKKELTSRGLNLEGFPTYYCDGIDRRVFHLLLV